jgi:hypothetical protein
MLMPDDWVVRRRINPSLWRNLCTLRQSKIFQLYLGAIESCVNSGGRFSWKGDCREFRHNDGCLLAYTFSPRDLKNLIELPVAERFQAGGGAI